MSVPPALRVITMLLLLATGPSACARTEPEPAAGPSVAREQLKALLAAFNSGDRPTLEQYAKASLSPNYKNSPTIDEALGMHKHSGGFDVLELTDVAPNVVKGWVRGRDSEALMEVVIEVEEKAPHRVEFFNLAWGNPPQKYYPDHLTEAAAVETLRAEVAKRTAADKFSGAVLLSRGDAVLLREAYGLADRNQKIPNTVDTRFRTASMGKMFTAVAVLRLVQEGKLKLSDPIGKIVQALAGKPAANVTIRQLLTHTAGTGDFYGPRLEENRSKLLVHDDFIKIFGDDALLFKPGEKYGYSNMGYILLGAAIEHASGKSYYDYIQETVFTPAGMTHSDLAPVEVSMTGRASGYYRPPGTHEWLPAIEPLAYRGDGAGGAWSTVDDMAKFFSALRANRLLSEKYTQLMFAPREKLWPGNEFGHGIFIESYPWSGRSLGHSGGEQGSNAEGWFMPDSGYVLVVMSNFDPAAATNVAGFIRARLPLH
ncbi:MAG TPA: serine hydrolase domain-containing protein [Steroidobacteraceae bacterium]|nr:serine hydrolase domain-containing protein [Steroidobacteraceae bacterium]